MNGIRYQRLLLTVFLFLLPSEVVLAQGVVLLTGKDVDQPLEGPPPTYAAILDNVLANVINKGSGILGIGVNPGSINDAWIQSVASLMAQAPGVTLVNDDDIDTVDFTQFAVLFVPSQANFPGISTQELYSLAARGPDVAAFVNGGGALFGLYNPGPIAWSYVSPTGAIVPQSAFYLEVNATPAAAPFGIDDDNVDGPFWHGTFLAFPGFLDVLAVVTNSTPQYNGQAAMLGRMGVFMTPRVDSPTQLAVECGGVAPTMLTAHVDDAEGDPLTVTWEVDGNVVQVDSVPSGGTTTSADVTLLRTFGGGEMIVTVTVDDGISFTSRSDTQLVFVDTTAPEVTGSVASTSLWPPNNKLVDIGLLVTAEDSCSLIAIDIQVFSDEDDDQFSPDAVNIAPGSLKLRAEREGKGDGRVYLIVIRAEDGSGNVGTTCRTVVIPKSQSPGHINDVAEQAQAALDTCANSGEPPPDYSPIGE